MNHLPQVFNYEGAEIRTIVKNEEVWFVASDVCKILDLNTSLAVNGRDRKDKDGNVYRDGGLDDDEKDIAIVNTLGGPQEMLIVNEAGLYSLIWKSRKPEAKAFKRWVTHEVLPTIRKTGGYVSNDDLFVQTYLPFADDQTKMLFKGVLETVRKQNEQIAAMKPKAEAHDRFISGENLQTMAQVAKALGTGRNRLFKFLREQKILMSNNMPYQQYIDRGYFEVKETPKELGGRQINFTQTYVTAKGVDFIFRLLQEQSA